jgi:hypothetical protein
MHYIAWIVYVGGYMQVIVGSEVSVRVVTTVVVPAIHRTDTETDNCRSMSAAVVSDGPSHERSKSS